MKALSTILSVAMFCLPLHQQGAHAQVTSPTEQVLHPTVRVVDAWSGKPLADCAVQLTGGAGTFEASTSPFGYAQFPSMTVVDAMPDPAFGHQEIVTASVQHPGFVPFHGRRALAHQNLHLTIALVPQSRRQCTPMVSARTGGRFPIPGVGTLTVPPEWLHHDARLCVTTIPHFAYSSGLFGTAIHHQVWISAVDRDGKVTSAIPAGEQRLLLETSLMAGAPVPGPVHKTFWVSRLVNASFEEVAQASVDDPWPRNQFVLPVGAGNNFVTRTWDPGLPEADGSPSDSASAAGAKRFHRAQASGIRMEEEFRVVFTGKRVEADHGTVFMNCGWYAASLSGKVAEGQAVRSSPNEKAAPDGSLGFERSFAVSKISANVGRHMEWDLLAKKATSWTDATRAQLPASGRLESVDGSQCLSSTIAVGLQLLRFRYQHTRRSRHPDGTITLQRSWMELEHSKGVTLHHNDIAWDPDCPDCELPQKVENLDKVDRDFGY